MPSWMAITGNTNLLITYARHTFNSCKRRPILMQIIVIFNDWNEKIAKTF